MKSENIILYLKSLTLRKNRKKLALFMGFFISFLTMVIGLNEDSFAASVLISKI